MRSRLSLGTFVFLVTIAATQLLTGCKSQIDDPAPSSFGAIRVINFADQTSPVDVYIQGVGQATDTLPSSKALGFGVASVYTTGLRANPAGSLYHVSIHPVNNRLTEIASADVTLKPDEKWSVTVYHNTGNSTFPTDVVQDIGNNPNSTSPVNNMVFVRFLNAYNNDAQYPMGLNLKVGDNLNGNPITSTPLKFRQHNDYQGIPFKTDTTFTFFLTDPSGHDSVIARLAGVTFNPGSYQTIVFTADLTKVGKNSSNPAGDALDSIRLRIIDDNGLGNDITSPSIPQSLRFNFINALVPVNNPAATDRTYAELGVVVNNDGNITFPNMKPLDVAPALSFFQPTYMDGNQLIHVTQFTSIPLTAAVNIKGYQTDGLAAGQRGTLLFDYKVGARTDIKSDIPVSFLIIDTPLKASVTADTLGVSHVAVPIPDNALPGQSRIVLVNGLAPTPTGPVASYVSMTVNGVRDNAFGSAIGGKKPTTYDNNLAPFTSGLPVTIVASMQKKGALNAETAMVTFTPKDGKIYEVVLVGERGSTKGFGPQFIVVETNPTILGGQDARFP